MSQTISQLLPSPSSDSSTTGFAPENADALSAFLGGVAFLRMDELGWMRITGEDRVRWLNGMVTNSIADLEPGAGCYNFVLNAQGQIQGDGTVFLGPSELLLETGGAQVATLMALLDRFIIMDDVELTEIPKTERSGILVAGPAAAALLAELGFVSKESPAAHLAQMPLRELPWAGGTIELVHAYSPLVPRFELWGAASQIAKLEQQLRARGTTSAGAQSLEWLRTLEGTPRFGQDIRGRELPQETAQTRALHFNKGCYLGQEIVERIRSRGKVNRTFIGFVLDDELPEQGAELTSNGQAVGVLTTVSHLPPCTALPSGARLALGYTRRDVIDSGRELTYTGGRATPATLPFTLGTLTP